MRHHPTTRTTTALALALALLTSVHAHDTQPPDCAYYLYAAQDMHHTSTTRYADLFSDLQRFTEHWDDHNACDQHAISATPPTTLTDPGDGTINAHPDAYDAYIWTPTSAWHITTNHATPHHLDNTPPQAPHESLHNHQTDHAPTHNHPTPTPTSDDPLTAAHELLEHGAYHQAEQAYAAILTNDVSNTHAHHGLARARYHQGRYHAAATSLELALALDDTDPRIHIDLATLRILTGDTQAAITSLTHALRTHDTSPHPLQPHELTTAHAHLAIAHQLRGQHALASTHYEHAATTATDPTPWQHAAIEARALSHSDATVIIDALQASQHHPSSHLHLIAARAYHDLGDHTARDQQLTLALQHATTPTEHAHALYAHATYHAHDRLERAQEAADLDPNLWQAAYTAALELLTNNDPHTALTYLQHAHHTNPQHPSTRAHLARAYLLTHQHNEALTHAHDLINDPSTSTDLIHHARITAAHAAHALGDRQRVILHLTATNTTDLDPNSLAILGVAHYDTGNYRAATTTLALAHERDPNNTTITRNLAQAYLATNEPAALDLLRALTSRYPNDATLHEQLAWAYRNAGDTTQADLAYRRANSLR